MIIIIIIVVAWIYIPPFTTSEDTLHSRIKTDKQTNTTKQVAKTSVCQGSCDGK